MPLVQDLDAPDAAAAAEVVGDKAAGLITMTRLGLPVPPGFVIACEAWASWQDSEGRLSEALEAEVDAALGRLAERAGFSFGDPQAPLLLAVRASPMVPFGVPGMVDTVLGVGLNEATVPGLSARTDDERFAWDAYRRFSATFAETVLGVHPARMQRAMSNQLGGRDLASLDADALRDLAAALRREVDAHGHAFPDSPRDQLLAAIHAIYRGYASHRARHWRGRQGIPDVPGVAVVVQAMVFGNRSEASAAGEVWSRDPQSGAVGMCGQWTPTGSSEGIEQGEGLPLNAGPAGGLREALPDAAAALELAVQRLESHHRDVVKVEFAVEAGVLFLLQCGVGVPDGPGVVQVAVDLVREGTLTRQEAVRRVQPDRLATLLRPGIPATARRQVLARGLDASPGAASGRVAFTPEDCEALHAAGEPAILVHIDTAPEDIQAITLAVGVVTARGGQTSHAAVVARGLGKPAVVGCADLHLDLARELFYAGDSVVRKGDWITLDGGTGEVLDGQLAVLAPQPDEGALEQLLSWADDIARVRVRGNADTGTDATRARGRGAVGVGLCRTEHMFFQPEALKAIRKMVLAEDPRSRQRALQDVLPLQRDAFREILLAMQGQPVSIRLLDPPLHAFLPARADDISAAARDLGVTPGRLKARLDELAEANPLLGHRGVRVGITIPELYRTQVRAIFEAACELARDGVAVQPEITVPLISIPAEMDAVRAMIVDVAEAVQAEFALSLPYKVGAMIELPRACLLAEAIARQADFFSLGTNDLSQMVYGMSLDDLGGFLPGYREAGILDASPATHFDEEGVGEMIQIAIARGRRGNPGLRVGVTGDHSGDPRAIRFLHKLGVDDVSVSALRVPVARLAAAHAALDDA